MTHRVEWRESPNWDLRPKGCGPELVVVHATEGAFPHDLAWLRRLGSKVSAHYYIGRDGRIVQLVKESRRAWHAGISRYHGRTGVNDFSLGVEMENDGRPYTAQQYDALGWLAADISTRRGIALDHFVGHSDVSGVSVRPDPKHDPGAHFDWSAFQRAFIQYRHPDPEPVKIAA